MEIWMLKLKPVKGDFVAIAEGVDLSKASAAEIQEIGQGLDQYGVLVFHDQPLSQDELVEFGAKFGPLDTSLQQRIGKRFFQDRLKNDAVSDISNVNSDENVADRSQRMAMMAVGNTGWHSDGSYRHIPARYSILSAVTAASWGGHTQFADLRSAYDLLDERTKQLIADKVAIFYSHNTREALGIEDSEAERSAFPPVRWPMVRTHPNSGRKILWCDRKVREIEGMSVPEGRALADELIEHIGHPDRIYSHGWRPDDVVMYDNRLVLHRGRRFDLTERREMRRVQVTDTVSSLGEIA
jgi:alpha-ketoglutarate-dependent 2,4-dichlorophenoxyacetate dioxygenase